MRRWAALAIAVGILVIAAAPRAADGPQVKKLGNAMIEYQDKPIHAVVAYEYSHRNHDTTWLFLDVALTTKERLSFDRGSFHLGTSANTTVFLAPESRFIEDGAAIQKIRQNAKIWNRNLSSYFIERPTASFRMFALPGDGVVTDAIVTDQYGPAAVTLFFESAEGSWKEGSYALTIDNGRAKAVLPIELK
jgi:hypothetical protein